MMTKCNTGCSYIDGYLNELGETIPASHDMLQARIWISRKLENATIDTAKIVKAKELIERYFEIRLMPWELLVLALVHCYESDGTLVFNEFFIMSHGDFLQIDTSRIRHIDVLKESTNIDKLISSGAESVNEVRRILGQPLILEPWADQHFITKNYGTVADVLAAANGGENK